MKTLDRKRRAAPIISIASLLLAAPLCAVAGSTWQDKVDAIIGWKGQTMPDEVLRYTLVPNLNVQISGRNVLANLVLDGYAAFHAEGSQVLVAAEIAALDSRVDEVVNTAT